MTCGAGMTIVQRFGWVSEFDATASSLLSIARILLILSIAYITYVLAMLYDRSHFDAVMLSKRGFENISNRLRKMYGKGASKQLLYSIGREAGRSRTAVVLKECGVTDSGLLKWLPYLYPLFGWGSRLNVEKAESDGGIVIRTIDNFEVSRDANDGGSSCDFTRGLFAGLGGALRPDMDCQSVETKCESRGDECCQFEVRFYPLNRM